jgi:hypothetical protein
MLEFILVNILFISLGGILYIIAKTLPKINEDENEILEKKSNLEKFIISDLPHKFDENLNFYTRKFFRKLKILILRLDNYLTHKLKNMNLDGEDKKINFNDLNRNSEEEPEITSKENNSLLKDLSNEK